MIRLRIAKAALVFGLFAVSAGAQPKSGDSHPDGISFGTVYVGAIVEGSFRVTAHGKDAIPFAVNAPRFANVRHKATESGKFGIGDDFTAGSVEFALDTSTAGDLSGEFSVMLGTALVKVPVTATVKPAKKRLTRVLIVETPFQEFSTKEGSLFKSWTDVVEKASLDVNYLLVTRAKPVLRELELGKFHCVLLAEGGVMDLQAADMKKLRKFAEAGGRVVVSANSFFMGSVEKANAVLDSYGIQMRNEEDMNHVTLRKSDFDPDLVKAGVTSAHFFRASPVAVTNEKTGRILVKAVGVGKAGDGFVVSANAGKGEVIALGESLWWNWISEKQAAGTDNALMLQWLLTPVRGK